MRYSSTMYYTDHSLNCILNFILSHKRHVICTTSDVPIGRAHNLINTSMICYLVISIFCVVACMD